MKVAVRLYATLSKYNPAGPGAGSFVVEVEPGTTLADLYERLKIPPGEVKQAFINGRRVEPDYVLQENDEIGVFPPVAGG